MVFSIQRFVFVGSGLSYDVALMQYLLKAVVGTVHESLDETYCRFFCIWFGCMAIPFFLQSNSAILDEVSCLSTIVACFSCKRLKSSTAYYSTI